MAHFVNHCLTGGLQPVVRNLRYVSNNVSISFVWNSLQHSRSVYNQRRFPFAAMLFHQKPGSTAQSLMFTALRNKTCPNQELQGSFGARYLPTLNQYRRGKAKTKNDIAEKFVPKEKKILLGPQRKGVCLKVFTRKPKKPNSGNRKCALLKLSNGKVITAYIPGERAVLQEHGVVLFEGGRVQDCPGIKYKIIRRKYDMN